MSTFLLSGIITREWSNDGKIGSGFKLYFYQSQTDTKQTIYSDVDGLIPHENPVTCNASGYMGAIYGRGIYRVVITDSFGQQITSPIDGVGADVGADGSAKYFFCETYDELRAITADYDFAYVCGRDEVGDGGQGLFQRITDSETDDDGVVLTNSTGNVIWKRVFSGYIDPRWYGLQYNAILSQSSALEKAMLGSFRFHIPVRLTDHVYIDQGIEFVEGSALVADEGAVITSTYSNSVLISGDSDIKGRLFGENVKGEFGSRYSKIYISWFGGQTDDDRLLKLYQAATNSTQILVVNETLNIGTNINISQPFTFEGGVINVNAGCENLWLYEFLDPSYISKIFNVTTSLTSVIIGRRHILPEYFGAKGNGSTNDSNAFQLACMNGLVRVIAGHTYKLSTQMTLPNVLEIVGAGILNIEANNLTCTTLTLDQCSVTYSGAGLWFDGTNLFATNCTISDKYQVANTKVINGCAYSESNLHPIFDGTTGPAIYRAHLPLILSAPALGTDENGKIVRSGLNKLLHDGMLWRSHNSPTAYYYGDSNHYSPYRRSSGLRFANGRLWFLGQNGYLFSSVDGIQPWSINVGLNAGGVQDNLPKYDNLVYGGGWYLASTSHIDGTTTVGLQRSSNGVSWTSANFYDPAYPPGGNSQRTAMYYDESTSTWIAGDYSGRVITSTDNGLTWTALQIKFDDGVGGQISAINPFARGFIGKFGSLYVLGDNKGGVYTNSAFQSEGWAYTDIGSALQIMNIVQLDNGKYKILGSFHDDGGTIVGRPFGVTVDTLTHTNLTSARLDQMPGFASIDQGYSFVTDTCHYNGVSFIGTSSSNINLENQGQIYACPDGSNTWCLVPRIVNLKGYTSYAIGEVSYDSSFFLCGGNGRVFASAGAGQVLSTH